MERKEEKEKKGKQSNACFLNEREREKIYGLNKVKLKHVYISHSLPKLTQKGTGYIVLKIHCHRHSVTTFEMCQ